MGFVKGRPKQYRHSIDTYCFGYFWNSIQWKAEDGAVGAQSSGLEGGLSALFFLRCGEVSVQLDKINTLLINVTCPTSIHNNNQSTTCPESRVSYKNKAHEYMVYVTTSSTKRLLKRNQKTRKTLFIFPLTGKQASKQLMVWPTPLFLDRNCFWHLISNSLLNTTHVQIHVLQLLHVFMLSFLYMYVYVL